MAERVFRWLHRTLGTLTIGPVVVWGLCMAGLIVLTLGFGCEVNEANVQPCAVGNRDLGELAMTLGFLATWGFLIFGMVAMGSGALWALVAIAQFVWKRQQAR